MNSRLDWLVFSDYYSIYVTNAPPLRNDCANTRFYAQISTFLLF